jgi:4'-phosphopantetheinyl transferase
MMSTFWSWNLPPPDLQLQANEVHAWRVALDWPEARVSQLYEILDADERARAERFYFRRDRLHFIVCRGVLRIILGRYLNLAPHQITFCYNAYGKPALDEALNGLAVRFNVAHSGGLALIAVTSDREVGVDLERMRPEIADLEIAQRFFSPQEVAVLQAISKDLQRQAFFNCWTRKEAYIKAKGLGLSLPLDQFEVSLIPGEPAALLSNKNNPDETSRWSLQELMPGADYAAALAIEGNFWTLKCWQWLED